MHNLKMVSLSITCINKSDRTSPHERISRIGGRLPDGSSWKILTSTAIHNIENNIQGYYVSIGGQRAEVVVATHLGNKYLKTTRDTTTVDNLLSLPECP